jgi:carbon-monoxide dehydrogenase medium subunit
MKPAPFIRHVPRTVEEVVDQLSEFAPLDGRILAGGQSLVPIMAFRMARPAHLIDINEVEGLDRLKVDGDTLAIGARVRHAAFHRPVVDGPLGQLLSYVVRHIAHYPIRMRGTFCGIMSTSLQEDELLAEVRLPLLSADTQFGFYEFSRRAGDFAMAAALVTYRIVNGVIVEARVGVGGAEASPRRISEAEALLNGKAPDTDVFRAAAEAAADAIDPLEDIQTTGEYRRDLVRAVTRRALERTLQ